MTPVLSQSALGDGETHACRIGAAEVLVCRVEGRFFAVSNRCSHAHQTLASGRLAGYEIRCPLHGARFDVRSGRCLAGPATEPIATYPVTLAAGRVFVAV